MPPDQAFRCTALHFVPPISPPRPAGTLCRMKRSDLTPVLLLSTVHNLGPAAWETLTAAFPEKVVEAAILREVRAGRLTFGVSLRLPYLTSEGESFIFNASLENAAPAYA